MPRAKRGPRIAPESQDYHSKKLSGFRLSDETSELIEALRMWYHVGRADIVEMAVWTLARHAAKVEGFPLAPPPK